MKDSTQIMFIFIIHLLRGIVCCQQRATYNYKVRDDDRNTVEKWYGKWYEGILGIYL